METVSNLVLAGSLLGLVTLDILAPARAFPTVRLWRIRGVVAFAAFLLVSIAAPLWWDGVLGEHRLVDATGLGPWVGGLVGIVMLQFFSYWWHRALHAVPFLWRFHQLHHSAERMDVFGAYWIHPVDVLGFTFAGSLALVLVVGVSPEAALVANTATGLCTMLQHANLRTPQWLGWIIQRPENHCVHHQRGVHAYNYGDFSLWDMVFGTYRNPKTWEGRAGFWDGASGRIGSLLVGLDVTEPPRRLTIPPTPAVGEHACARGSAGAR